MGETSRFKPERKINHEIYNRLLCSLVRRFTLRLLPVLAQIIRLSFKVSTVFVIDKRLLAQVLHLFQNLFNLGLFSFYFCFGDLQNVIQYFTFCLSPDNQ